MLDLLDWKEQSDSKFVCLLARITRNISNDDLEFVEKAQYSVLGTYISVFSVCEDCLSRLGK